MDELESFGCRLWRPSHPTTSSLAYHVEQTDYSGLREEYLMRMPEYGACRRRIVYAENLSRRSSAGLGHSRSTPAILMRFARELTLYQHLSRRDDRKPPNTN